MYYAPGAMVNSIAPGALLALESISVTYMTIDSLSKKISLNLIN